VSGRSEKELAIAHREVLLERLHRDGFFIVPSVIDGAAVESLLDSLEAIEDHSAVREKAGSAYAVRILCKLAPRVRELSRSIAIRSLVEPVLGESARVVRSLLFDKTPTANWKVPWHQDLTIAVRRRHDAAGFGPWSVKAGVTHVQPPSRVLEEMLTVRLHLDDCMIGNGPLRVLPGSHRLGVIKSESIPEIRRRIPEVACTLSRGDALLMRPLLLHASSPAATPAHRRVVHLEFAAGDLPGGMEWHES
jgi:ectoine hydroxylase-related dioxygenase (phytanoyl-CoA dioxygenase family)